MNEPFTIKGIDTNNPETHVIIEVRNVEYSVATGKEQQTANEIAFNLDN